MYRYIDMHIRIYTYAYTCMYARMYKTQLFSMHAPTHREVGVKVHDRIARLPVANRATCFLCPGLPFQLLALHP